MSLVSEIANQHVPIPRAVKQEIAENSKPQMMYSRMTATKYPIGLVVSNGNLLNARVNKNISENSQKRGIGMKYLPHWQRQLKCITSRIGEEVNTKTDNAWR